MTRYVLKLEQKQTFLTKKIYLKQTQNGQKVCLTDLGLLKQTQLEAVHSVVGKQFPMGGSLGHSEFPTKGV